MADDTRKRDVPLYLARYRERAAERSARPENDGAPFYLRRFRPRSSGPPSEHGNSAEVIEVHLVRHGQTQGYTVDGGLTPLGGWQARRRGHDISKSVKAGETVVLVAAETVRTLRTAEYMQSGIEDGLALWGKDARIAGPELMEEFENFRVSLPSGIKEPTQAFREYQVQSERHERTGIGPRPMWLVEMNRFWSQPQDGRDPIAYWMTTPLVCFEPPALVVRRYWAGLVRLAEAWSSAARIVCAVNSGPIRAFAASALAYDLGEPHNTEEVRVRLRRDLREAQVSYRGHTQNVQVPSVLGFSGWDGAGNKYPVKHGEEQPSRELLKFR